MRLQLKTFNTLVQDMAAAVQASANQILDLTVGSTLRAILESNASIGLWIQWLVLQVLQMTRAATSSGADLDSWMSDFSLERLSATSATGIVTLSRFTATTSALVPAGALVRTGDGAQMFSVLADASRPQWDPVQNGYIVNPGVVSIDVPVVAQTPGSDGNVQANTVTLLASALQGIDAVNNAAPFLNGSDAESDPEFRQRFQNFLASRSRATPLAVEYAITSVQPSLNYAILENTDPSGANRPGSFLVVVDDGSGAPSQSLLSTIQSSIDAVRPIGSAFGVIAPTVTPVAVSLTLTVANPADKPSIIPQVTQALTSFINTLPIGAPLPATRIAQTAYAASSAITNVTQVLLNGGATDITTGPTGAIKLSSVVVS